MEEKRRKEEQRENRGEGVRPWRQIGERPLDSIRNDTADTTVDPESNIRANILLVGPVGAGKSSFAKSVLSIDQGRLNYNPAIATRDSASVTFKHTFYDPDTCLKNVRIIDTPGIMEAANMGLLPDDFEYILEGNIKEGYRFHPDAAFERNGAHYIDRPALENKIHCAVIVVDCRMLSSMHEKHIKKIGKLQNLARIKGIPTFVMLTKCDVECEGVKQAIGRIFSSRNILRAVKKAEEIFNIPMAHIHPVVNFGAEEAAYMDPDISRWLLYALQEFVNASSDYVNYQRKKMVE